jgi:hypothetical protein
MSIADMRTMNTASESSLSVGGGVGYNVGIGEFMSVNSHAYLAIGSNMLDTASFEATRLSDMHYAYSFDFESEFSTSADPNTAGHASDVIIGGGVDVRVVEGIAGELSYVFFTSRNVHLILIISVYFVLFLKNSRTQHLGLHE